MNRNFNFNDYDAIPPKSINKPHMPVVLLCDISGSMAGMPIKNLNASINRFSADICRDPKAADMVDVMVIGFNEKPHIEQDWRPIADMRSVMFEAGGGTNLSSALELAVHKLRERGHLYVDEIGIDVRGPSIILITDGYGGDVSAISEIIRKRVADKKMILWTLAVKGYDAPTIAKLSDGKRVFELVDENGYDFTEFFQFAAEFVKAVSTSAPGQRIHIPDSKNPLKKENSNLQVPDLDDWVNM